MKNLLKKLIDIPINHSNEQNYGNGPEASEGKANGIYKNGNFSRLNNSNFKNVEHERNFEIDGNIKNQKISRVTVLKRLKHNIDKIRDSIAEKWISLGKKLPVSLRKFYALPVVALAYQIGSDNFRKKGLISQATPVDFTDIINISNEINKITDFIEKSSMENIKLDEKVLLEKVLILATQLTGFTGAGLWRYIDETKVIEPVAFANHPSTHVEKIHNYSVRAAISAGTLDSTWTKDKYEKSKNKNGFINQAIFENKIFSVADINNLPTDMSISMREMLLLAQFDPDSFVVSPFGYSDKKGYAMGVMTFVHDKNIASQKNINIKSLVLDAFCQLAADLIQYFRFINSKIYNIQKLKSEKNEEVRRKEQIYKLAITKSLQNLYAMKVAEVLDEKNKADKNLKIIGGKHAYNALKSSDDIKDLIENSKSSYAAILFADIKNFTRKSENLFKKYGMEKGSDKLFKFLNGFNSAINPSIASFGGQIDKFLV
jgi:hypothetical protein